MWFHLEPRGVGYAGALSGVAISDRMASPYTFVRAIRPNAGYWPINVQTVHKTKSIPPRETFWGSGLPMHLDSLNILGRDMPDGQMARGVNLFVDDDGVA